MRGKLRYVMGVMLALSICMPAGAIRTLAQEGDPAEQGGTPNVVVVAQEPPVDTVSVEDEPASEEVLPEGGDVGRPLRAGEPMKAAASANLSDFLTDVAIDAPTDEDGSYIVNPNNSYEVTLSFRENEDLQFDDGAQLTYDFPEGMLMSDVGAAPFDISIVDENGSATISGNTYEIQDGQLRVMFNQSDPNYDRLTALSNVSFHVTVSSKFDQTVGEVAFNADVIKDFVFEETSDIAIEKSVVYDKGADTANYALTVTSTGTNENVAVQDQITGTALTLNQDVSVVSSVGGPLSVTPDYASVENGFSVTIPRMTDGEVLTIHYSAAVDNEKITGLGTSDQTSNRATVSSNEVPGGKEDEADLSGKINFHKIGKEKAGDPVPLGDNKYEVPWQVRINEDHKLTIGGKTIMDYVHSDSQPFMHYAGAGITMEVTFENGASETRVIPWADLRTTSNDKGMIGWEYDAPESDGKASYLITYASVVDTTGVPGERLTVRNRAQVGNNYSDGSATIGIIGDDQLTIDKEVINCTSRESTWQITVHVIKEGYPNLKVVDDLPELLHEGTYYFDELVEDSIQVEGLLPGESWKLTKNFYESGRTIHLDFYQDEAQAITGLKPTADGQPRDIVITFKTTVNQEWLEIAAHGGYTSNQLHRNSATARVSGYIVGDSAQAFPKRQTFRKGYVGSGSVAIDGVSYPVYRYVLTLENPCDEMASISDAFDTTYLKYYADEAIRIVGGTESEQNDSDGAVSAVDTAAGIDVSVSRFPKDDDGKFYPVYHIYYSLIVKDGDALDALNSAATQDPDGYTLENTATWNELTSDTVGVVHTYYPYVDKELLARPTAENGRIAEFKVIINQYADDLDPASDTLVIQDVLSSNLRFIPGSLSISPANDSIKVGHDSETNTLTFTDVPDGTRFEVTYQARVLGTGNVTYSNTVKFGHFEKTVEESTEINSSGGGTGSNPSITLVKRDKEALSATLPGATFQLFYMNDDTRVPVKDKDGQDVTFTTGEDGTVLIVGNQQNLGWTLWVGRTYCLVETVAPAGYAMNEEPTYFVLSENPASQTEYNITGDTLTIQDEAVKVGVSVRKAWVGPEGGPVAVRLLADGADTGRTLTLSADKGWADSFSGLSKYKADGTEVAYTVEEDPVEGYASEVSGDAAGGFTITNTNTETTTVEGSKTWDDGGDRDGVRPESITVRLLADGVEVDSTSVEADAEGNWSYSFDGLPRYDPSDGHEIAYTVTEDAVPNYTPEITGNATDGFSITNSHAPGKTSVTATKAWDDASDQDGIRPDSIQLQLYADGEPSGDPVTLSADNQWAHTWTNLFQREGGQDIAYTVAEVGVPGGYEVIVTGDAASGFSVTNKHVPEVVSVPVTKAWVGPEGGPVTVRLLADGADTGKTLTLSADNSWAGSFDGLAKNAGGKAIEYTVSEDPVEGYTAEVSGDAASGFTITNTRGEVPPPPAPGRPGKALPRTGDAVAPASAVATLAACLLAAGGALALVARRRRRG